MLRDTTHSKPFLEVVYDKCWLRLRAGFSKRCSVAPDHSVPQVNDKLEKEVVKSETETCVTKRGRVVTGLQQLKVE
jgi:hypothetical protein